MTPAINHVIMGPYGLLRFRLTNIMHGSITPQACLLVFLCCYRRVLFLWKSIILRDWFVLIKKVFLIYVSKYILSLNEANVFKKTKSFIIFIMY